MNYRVDRYSCHPQKNGVPGMGESKNSPSWLHRLLWLPLLNLTGQLECPQFLDLHADNC